MLSPDSDQYKHCTAQQLSFSMIDYEKFRLSPFSPSKYSRWEELMAMLEKIGFKNINRLTGTNPTDFNLNKIKADPYGLEKFGDEEIRLIAFK